MRRSLWAPLILGLLGCADAPDEPPCSLSVSLSGYITATMPEQLSCGSRTGGIELSFAPGDEGHPIGGFVIIVDNVERGDVGDFPATVIVFSPTGGMWETDKCTVTIEDHTNRGQVCHQQGHNGEVCEDVDSYRVRGRGECREPVDEPAGVPLTIGPFEFVSSVWWPR